MKVVLKVLITLLGLCSIMLGFILFSKNANLAKEVAGYGNTMGLLPSEGSLKNGAITAAIAALGTFIMIVISYLKNPNTMVITSVISMGLLAASYFIQPDYNASLIGGELSKSIALNQLLPGVVAAGLTLLLSRRKDKPILTFA